MIAASIENWHGFTQEKEEKKREKKRTRYTREYMVCKSKWTQLRELEVRDLRHEHAWSLLFVDPAVWFSSQDVAKHELPHLTPPSCNKELTLH